MLSVNLCEISVVKNCFAFHQLDKAKLTPFQLVRICEFIFTILNKPAAGFPRL